MPIAVMRYKCRRCQTAYDCVAGPPIHASNALMSLNMLIAGNTPTDSFYRMHDVHPCEDHGLGVADLIGADIREG